MDYENKTNNEKHDGKQRFSLFMLFIKMSTIFFETTSLLKF